VVLVALMLVLSSCSLVTSAYVVRTPSGGYQLVVPPQCSLTIVSVVVKHSGDPDDDVGFDDLETIWAARADGAGREAVTLLDENDGYTSEWSARGVAADARVVIGWAEVHSDGDVSSNSLAGTLADMGEGDLLWYDGVTSRDEYDRAVRSPSGRFSC